MLIPFPGILFAQGNWNATKEIQYKTLKKHFVNRTLSIDIWENKLSVYFWRKMILNMAKNRY